MRTIISKEDSIMATPRTPLPVAALTELSDALGQLEAAKSELRILMRVQNVEVTQRAVSALDKTQEAIIRIIEAKNIGRVGGE